MYYYGNDGQRVYGWQLIGGNTYYFGENGVMRTGYQGTLPVPGDGEQQTNSLAICSILFFYPVPLIGIIFLIFGR